MKKKKDKKMEDKEIEIKDKANTDEKEETVQPIEDKTEITEEVSAS